LSQFDVYKSLISEGDEKNFLMLGNSEIPSQSRDDIRIANRNSKFFIFYSSIRSFHAESMLLRREDVLMFFYCHSPFLFGHNFFLTALEAREEIKKY
jgi:hypothetical protein